jgi:hypothetical protein
VFSVRYEVICIGNVEKLVAQMISYWLFTAQARVRSQISPLEVYGGQSDTARGFSPSAWVSSLLPLPYWSEFYNCKKDKRAKPGTLQIGALLNVCGQWAEKCFDVGFSL